MRQKRGNSLPEYAIILGIVLLGAIPVYFALGKNIVDAFQGYIDVFASNKHNVSQQLNPEVSYDLQQTDETPVVNTPPVINPENPTNLPKTCTNGTCEIDFGEFMLQGIPQDTTEIVETMGTSGGTDLLADLIMQIAKQYQDDGKPKQAEQLKRLAGVGHNIAAIEKGVETLVASCNKDLTCMKNSSYGTMPKPANYNDAYGTYDSSQVYLGQINRLIDSTWYKFVQKDGTYETKLAKGELGAVFLNQIDIVNADPAISSTTKNVVNELSKQIGILAEGLEGPFMNSTGINTTYSTDMRNFLTGELIPYEEVSSDPLTNMQTFNYSKLTNFDSALICASGLYKDTGIQCD